MESTRLIVHEQEAGTTNTNKQHDRLPYDWTHFQVIEYKSVKYKYINKRYTLRWPKMFGYTFTYLCGEKGFKTPPYSQKYVCTNKNQLQNQRNY